MIGASRERGIATFWLGELFSAAVGRGGAWAISFLLPWAGLIVIRPGSVSVEREIDE